MPSFRLSVPSEFSYIVGCAVEVVGGVTSPSVTETTTVLILGIILSAFGIAFFCWLLFTLAVYALPFFVAMTAGFAALHSGAGFIGAIVIGIVVGIVTLAAGQLSFAIVRSPVVRAAIALFFAVPAAAAGYHATLGLSQIGAPSHWWAEAFAFIGAVLVGATTGARVTLFAYPPGIRRVLPSGSVKLPSAPPAVNADRLVLTTRDGISAIIQREARPETSRPSMNRSHLLRSRLPSSTGQ